jgi:hypothetical protein
MAFSRICSSVILVAICLIGCRESPLAKECSKPNRHSAIPVYNLSSLPIDGIDGGDIKLIESSLYRQINDDNIWLIRLRYIDDNPKGFDFSADVFMRPTSSGNGIKYGVYYPVWVTSGRVFFSCDSHVDLASGNVVSPHAYKYAYVEPVLSGGDLTESELPFSVSPELDGRQIFQIVQVLIDKYKSQFPILSIQRITPLTAGLVNEKMNGYDCVVEVALKAFELSYEVVLGRNSNGDWKVIDEYGSIYTTL